MVWKLFLMNLISFICCSDTNLRNKNFLVNYISFLALLIVKQNSGFDRKINQKLNFRAKPFFYQHLWPTNWWLSFLSAGCIILIINWKKHLMVRWIRTRTWLFSGLHDPKPHTDIIIQAFLIQSWAELRPVSERGFSVTDSELCSFKSSRNSGLFRINLHLKEITPSFCCSCRLERKISPD